MNVDEPIPEEFFIFVNRLNSITEHNFRLAGRFFSAAFASLEFPGFLAKYLNGKVRYLPFEPCAMEPMALSPYFITAINDYRLEYDIEVHREHHCNLFPSRFSAVYAYATEEACREVNRRYGWPLDTVKRFKLIDNPLNRVVRVNMEHVSLARHAYKVSQLEGVDDLWRNYWAGVGNIEMSLPAAGFTRKTHSSGVIWEYLIKGVVQHED